MEQCIPPPPPRAPSCPCACLLPVAVKQAMVDELALAKLGLHESNVKILALQSSLDEAEVMAAGDAQAMEMLKRGLQREKSKVMKMKLEQDELQNALVAKEAELQMARAGTPLDVRKKLEEVTIKAKGKIVSLKEETGQLQSALAAKEAELQEALSALEPAQREVKRLEATLLDIKGKSRAKIMELYHQNVELQGQLKKKAEPCGTGS